MIKRLFEYLALSLLAVLGLAKLRGKRVNPLALRILLGILSFLALCLASKTVLLFSGTWLLFLLAGDVGRIYGVNLSLFLPAAEGDESGSAVPEYALTETVPADPADIGAPSAPVSPDAPAAPVADAADAVASEDPNVISWCARRFKSFALFREDQK